MVVPKKTSNPREVFLACGTRVLVSEEDFVYLSYWSWSMQSKRYAGRKQGGKCLYMHKIIAERVGLKGEIDHENRDKLDNRRENLREATRSQNIANASIRADNLSGYRGVSYDSANQKWLAQISVEGKYLFLGRFGVAKEAAIAYNNAAQKHFGIHAFLNEV